MLISLAEYAYKKSPLKSFHCFPFGGFEKTCLWLNEIQNGDVFDCINIKKNISNLLIAF
jgi:hypothetical protein